MKADDLCFHEHLKSFNSTDSSLRYRSKRDHAKKTYTFYYEKYTSKNLALFVERFFQLWSRNQWKRERYAPSFHLDDENLDPKTWCRFPILSGGFSEELMLLREAVKKD